MKTDDLIGALATDLASEPNPPSLERGVSIALFAALAVTAMVFMATLGPRPGALDSLGSPRFVFKFAVTLVLALVTAALAVRLSRPGADTRFWTWSLLAWPVMLGVAAGLELASVAPDAWMTRMIGTNSMVCLVVVPLLAALPLGALLVAMRRGAPARPGAAGAAAGVLSGALGAFMYASHCIDDSPLFVAVWYSLAIAFVAAAGAAIGSRLLKW